MPLYLGLAVVGIILIAFFSKGEESSKKAVATLTPAAPSSSTTSKKSKKKKSASKAKAAASSTPAAAEKKVTIQESPTVVEPEPDTKSASKKKKKKSKKKKGGNSAASAGGAESAPKSPASPKTVVFANDDDDDDESDDDIDLFAIQSVSTRKGGTDAAKRAASNKERDRVRALKRQEEKSNAKKKAVDEADAAEKAKKEEEELAAAAEAAELAAEAEKKTAATAAKAKKNGASINGASEPTPAAATVTGEKKKRKRKKKKGGAAFEDSARPVLVTPAPSPSAEQWETVPLVEEWQEVGSKKAKQQAKMKAVVSSADGADAAFLSDEPVVEEPGETSVSLSAGEDPLIFIGKGGSTITNLQNTSGAKFHLNRSTNILTISGLEDAVQIGLAAANSILAAYAERKANETEERVTWGKDAIKAVIGRGGANIRATQEATGVRIDADVEAGTLVIVGPSEEVATALTMCHNAAFGEVQEVIELGSRNAVNLVYGPSFQTIRSLQESTGCKLDITRGSTTVKLAGSSEAVAEATERIRALLEANRGFEMTIENSKVGAVYGKGGETLRTIQDRTGTQIDVSRGPTHATVSVMGTVDSSARARNMLQRAIDGEVELQPGEVAEEIELGSATAAVIGRGGSNVAQLEKTHGVKINVRSEFQKARVVGKPDKVEAAAKDINAIAKPILEAEAAQKEADAALETGESAWQVDAVADDAEGW